MNHLIIFYYYSIFIKFDTNNQDNIILIQWLILYKFINGVIIDINYKC